MKAPTRPVRARAALAGALLLPALSFSTAAPVAGAPAAPAPDAFSRDFLPRTMRINLFHTGGKGVEILAVEGIRDDGPWAGSRTQLVDELGLGAYLVEVLDPPTQRLLYSRGYSSLFGEWETTAEAKSVHRTLRESVRFPWPRRPVQVVVKRRDKQNLFHELFTQLVDPSAREVNLASPPQQGSVWTVFENGPTETKVDLLVLGDGYSSKDLPKFHDDVKRLVGVLFTYEPFKSRQADFNVRALDVPSPQSGVLRPQSGVYLRTPLSVQYDVFGSERYVLTYDDQALREAAAQAPYDAIAILVNDSVYGGGGIYNDQATCAAGTGFADYVFVHEFGHAFAGLGDEYYTSDVAYETGRGDFPEPWEPNVTALKDPDALKWRDLVAAGTPLPTPWSKEAFEKQSLAYQARRKKLLAGGAAPSEVDALFREQREAEKRFFSAEKYLGKVGAFEGASYEAHGLYRPSVDCIMFTRTTGGFCPVCRRAIERVIDTQTR